MIVLNKDRQLLRVDVWDDILARPAFTDDLDPSRHELREIIGRYGSSDRIRCGLSNCHTLHAKGYIVVTKDGLETNIGKDCGKTYFGVDFETLSRKFDQDITDKENRESLWSFNFRLEEIKEHVKRLRSEVRGADWVYKKTRPLVEANRGVPLVLVRQITEMVKTSQSALTKPREATEREVEKIEVELGRAVDRPHYIEDFLAQIEGLDALRQDSDLRQMLILDVQTNLSEFERVAIDELSSEGLKRWSRWIGTVDATLERAASVIDLGRRLLRPLNLQHFCALLTRRDEHQEFKTYLRSLE